MEYIHKAKAEKSRTKVLNDQMEARRTKNKVPYLTIPDDRTAALFHSFRPPGNVVLKELLRRGKRSWLWKMHLQRSKCSSHDPSRMSLLLLYAMYYRMLPPTSAYAHSTASLVHGFQFDCMISKLAMFQFGSPPRHDFKQLTAFISFVASS